MDDPVLNIVRKVNIHQDLASRFIYDFEKRRVEVELEQYDASDPRYVPLTLYFEGVRSVVTSDLDLQQFVVQELAAIGGAEKVSGTVFLTD